MSTLLSSKVPFSMQRITVGTDSKLTNASSGLFHGSCLLLMASEGSFRTMYLEARRCLRFKAGAMLPSESGSCFFVGFLVGSSFDR